MNANEKCTQTLHQLITKCLMIVKKNQNVLIKLSVICKLGQLINRNTFSCRSYCFSSGFIQNISISSIPSIIRLTKSSLLWSNNKAIIIAKSARANLYYLFHSPSRSIVSSLWSQANKGCTKGVHGQHELNFRTPRLVP